MINPGVPQVDFSGHADGSGKPIIRLYDVHDLCGSRYVSGGADRAYEQELNSTSNNQQKNPQGGGGMPSGPPRISPSNPLMEKMVDAILETVHPLEWDSYGGTAACITCVDRTLIITGDASLHHDVAAFLDALRKANANSLVADR